MTAGERIDGSGGAGCLVPVEAIDQAASLSEILTLPFWAGDPNSSTSRCRARKRRWTDCGEQNGQVLLPNGQFTGAITHTEQSLNLKSKNGRKSGCFKGYKRIVLQAWHMLPASPFR